MVVIPIPFAASIVAGSIPRIPVYVLSKMGGMPMTIKARMAGNMPMPRIGTNKMSTAMMGIARNKPLTFSARKARSALRDTSAPSVTPMMIATRIERLQILR